MKNGPLIKRIEDLYGVSHTKAMFCANVVLGALQHEILAGNEVYLNGFAKFYLRFRKGRKCKLGHVIRPDRPPVGVSRQRDTWRLTVTPTRHFSDQIKKSTQDWTEPSPSKERNGWIKPEPQCQTQTPCKSESSNTTP